MIKKFYLWIKQDKKFSILILLYFVTYFIVGVLCCDDYGYSVDEAAQRKHSLVAYKYINETVFHRNVEELQDLPALEEYESKFYGTAIQLPMVFIEDLSDFTMSSRQIYLMRHFFTFIIVYAGYIFFFLALKMILNDSKLSFFGVLFISLYPRFVAYQFVDIKNMVFVGLNMITFFALVYAVEKKSFFSYILFGFTTALATNHRIMAIVYPALLVGYFLVSDISNLIIVRLRKEKIRRANIIKKYATVIVSYCFFWYIISPFAWANPIDGFVNTFLTFSSYNAWDGTMVFMGKLITCDEMPWYYLLVWFGISIPVSYLYLFVYCHYSYIIKIINSPNKWNDIIYTFKWHTCAIVLFWGIVGSIIILKSRIYVGWHHVFFAFVPFCTVTAFGLMDIVSVINRKKIFGIVSSFVLIQCMWMICNHPYEGVYLNIVGKLFGDKFDREEWQISSYPAIKWILNNEANDFSVAGSTGGINMLTETEKSRIVNEDVPMYIINCYRNVIGNDLYYDGYEEVYTISVDGYNICSIFKKQDIV